MDFLQNTYGNWFKMIVFYKTKSIAKVSFIISVIILYIKRTCYLAKLTLGYNMYGNVYIDDNYVRNDF